MSRSEEERARDTGDVAGPESDRAATVGRARQLLGLRRLREEMLGADLFADPAWDLLLHLYVQTAAGDQVAISALCAAAQVRPTTGLRWINLLVDAGLLEKSADPADARRVFISLAPGTEDRIRSILTEALADSATEALAAEA